MKFLNSPYDCEVGYAISDQKLNKEIRSMESGIYRIWEKVGSTY
jgi:hypothetical protein